MEHGRNRPFGNPGSSPRQLIHADRSRGNLTIHLSATGANECNVESQDPGFTLSSLPSSTVGECYDLDTVFANISSTPPTNNTRTSQPNPLNLTALNANTFDRSASYDRILYDQQQSADLPEGDPETLGARHIRFFRGAGCDQTVKNPGGAPVEQWPYVAWSCVSEEAACFDAPFGIKSFSIGNADMRHESGCVEHELRGSAIGSRASGVGPLMVGILVAAVMIV